MTDKKSGVRGRGHGEDPSLEQGFERWLNRQLHHLYDPVLSETVPDEILRLLQQFDAEAPSAEPPPGPSPAKPDKPDEK